MENDKQACDIQSHLVDGNVLRISIEGRFDFDSHSPFRETYRYIANEVKSATINFSKVTYIDSAALGMLLLFKESLPANTPIQLVGTNDKVRQLFTITKFDEMFDIS
jgi:anti-anti-sigma factor